MRVVVTGATGFVGSAVVRALARREHEVVAMVRRAADSKRLPAGVRPVVADVTLAPTVRTATADADVIVHTASATPRGRMTTSAMAEMDRVDALAAATLADVAAASGAHFIYTSSTLVYGDHGEEWITASTTQRPAPLARGHAQVEADLLARQHTDAVRLTVVRPGWVYGPGGVFKKGFYDTWRKGRLASFGAGHQFWSPVHVDDLGEAYALAAERPPAGHTYDVVDDHPTREREILDAFTTALDAKRVRAWPPAILRVVLGRALVDSLLVSFRVPNEVTRNELGWQPEHPSFTDGIGEVVQTLRRADI